MFPITFGDVVIYFMACFPKCITLDTIMCFNVFMSNMWMFKYALMIDVNCEGQLVWIMIPRLLQGVVCGNATMSSVLHVADDIMRMEIRNVQLHFGAVDAAIVCTDRCSMYCAHFKIYVPYIAPTGLHTFYLRPTDYVVGRVAPSLVCAIRRHLT